jgi:hypothetical protein
MPTRARSTEANCGGGRSKGEQARRVVAVIPGSGPTTAISSIFVSALVVSKTTPMAS